MRKTVNKEVRRDGFITVLGLVLGAIQDWVVYTALDLELSIPVQHQQLVMGPAMGPAMGPVMVLLAMVWDMEVLLGLGLGISLTYQEGHKTKVLLKSLELNTLGGTV